MARSRAPKWITESRFGQTFSRPFQSPFARAGAAAATVGQPTAVMGFQGPPQPAGLEQRLGAPQSQHGNYWESEETIAGGAPGYHSRDPRNVDSQLTPTEYDDASYEAARELDDTGDETDEAIVNLILERFRDSSLHRRPVEREWVLAVAMREGRQWLAWDDATHRAVSLINEEEPDRYVTHNLIRPLLTKSVSMATQTKPDANCQPDGDSDMDRAAASEGRVVTAHLARQNGGSRQTREVAMWAASCGCGYTKHYWDNTASADVPIFGPGGQIVGKQSVRGAGEEREDVLGPFEIFLDPLAKRWSDVGWVIHAVAKPLSWFVEQYGERGKLVSGDTRDAYQGFVESYMTNAYGGVSQVFDWFVSGINRKAAICYEMWEKPTPRFPEGRLFVVAGRQLLRRSRWPLQFKVAGRFEFPFSRMVYEEASGHAYGAGLVKDVVPLQIALNRTLSRIIERTEEDKLTVAIPGGANIGADAFETDEGRHVRKIYYDIQETGGLSPSWMPPPPLSADNWRLIDTIWLHMQHIAGVHDVNQGGVPAGVDTGVAIGLLQEGDQTQLSTFTGNIEQYVRMRDECRLAHYAQFASPYLPRMMGMDDSGNPAEGLRRAQAFMALSRGGSAGVYVVEGSATPKSAAGQRQEILDMAKAGVFGKLGEDPEASIAVVKLLEMTGSDLALDLIYQWLQRKLATQPDPAQIEMIKRQAAMQQMQMQLQAEDARQQVLVRSQSELTAVKAHAQMEINAQKAALEMQQTLLERMHPQITGTMDQVAVVDLEAMMGIRGQVPPPPPPKQIAAGSGAGSRA